MSQVDTGGGPPPCSIAVTAVRALVFVLAVYFVYDAWKRRVHRLVKRFRVSWALFLLVNAVEAAARTTQSVTAIATFDAFRVPLGYIGILYALEHASRNMCAKARREYPRWLEYFIPIMRVASVVAFVAVSIYLGVEQTNRAWNATKYTTAAYLICCFLPIFAVYVRFIADLFKAEKDNLEQQGLVDKEMSSYKRNAIIIGVLLILLPLLSAYLVLNELPSPPDAQFVPEICESSWGFFWLSPALYALLLVVTREGRTRFEEGDSNAKAAVDKHSDRSDTSMDQRSGSGTGLTNSDGLAERMNGGLADIELESGAADSSMSSHAVDSTRGSTEAER